MRSAFSGLLTGVLATAGLASFCGAALAVKATPDTVYCSPSACEVCVEYEHTKNGDRCLKCEIRSTPYCLNKSGAEWQPGNPAWATAKDDVDVYDSPVKPRHVIGMMIALSRGIVLDYHPDGWCKLKQVGDGFRDGWVAQDHLDGCP
jgi:hypothetical protein